MSEEKSSPSEPETAPAQGEGNGPTPITTAAAAPATPEQRIAALETERDEARDRMLRLAAEFENYKKRVRREQQEGESKVRESVLKDVLEVADNLERAAAVDEKADFKSLQKGVELVLRLFQNKLERNDVRPFESKGQAFDPRIHDAVSQIPSPDVPAGSVVNEIQKGYRIGDRLLRPALVVVAVAPPAAPSGNGAAS
jgi:molecular chaperone GrpE